MERRPRPEIPKEKIIQVNNSKKIDFNKPFKFIYMDWWFNLLTAVPIVFVHIITYVFAVFLGLRIEGRKNMKILRKQGCIVVSNHCHYFDTVFANVFIFPSIMHTSVAQRNFEVPIVRRILRIIRCFPIPANGRGLEMIRESVKEALKRKHHIMVLPEGDLVVRSQTIHRFRMGAFILSYWNQAPVVPMVYVIKPRRFMRKFMVRLIGPDFWIKMKLVVGEPIYPPKPAKDDSLPMEDLKDMADKAASWMEDTIAMHQTDTQASPRYASR